MSWLLVALLKNAILVVPLALLALAAGRWSRRPALAHLLWVVVLIKLLTPPLVDVPLGYRLDVETWLGLRQEAPGHVQSAALPRIAPQLKSGAAAPQSPRNSRRRTESDLALVGLWGRILSPEQRAMREKRR